MTPLADLLAKHTYTNKINNKPWAVKENPSAYSSHQLKTKARIYSIVSIFLSAYTKNQTTELTIKYPTPATLLIQVASRNNSFVTSLTLIKTRLAQEIRPLLEQEDLINQNAEIIFQPKLL